MYHVCYNLLNIFSLIHRFILHRIFVLKEKFIILLMENIICHKQKATEKLIKFWLNTIAYPKLRTWGLPFPYKEGSDSKELKHQNETFLLM